MHEPFSSTLRGLHPALSIAPTRNCARGFGPEGAAPAAASLVPTVVGRAPAPTQDQYLARRRAGRCGSPGCAAGRQGPLRLAGRSGQGEAARRGARSLPRRLGAGARPAHRRGTAPRRGRAGARRGRPLRVSALVLNAGALIAVDRDDRAMLACLRSAEQHAIGLRTSAIVVAQVGMAPAGRRAAPTRSTRPWSSSPRAAIAFSPATPAACAASPTPPARGRGSSGEPRSGEDLRAWRSCAVGASPPMLQRGLSGAVLHSAGEDRKRCVGPAVELLRARRS